MEEKLNKWLVKLYIREENKASFWSEVGKGVLNLKKNWNSKTEYEEDSLEIVKIENWSAETEITPEKFCQIQKNMEPNEKDVYIIRSRITKENEYERQTKQVISIVDKDLVEEMGLSFHDISACNETWRMICNAIGKNPHENNDVIEEIDLPDITNNENFLDKLLDELENKIDLGSRSFSINDKLLNRLKEKFETAEDLEFVGDLDKLFKIINIMIFSNESSILEKLMDDFFYISCFGALEYDPENFGPHRKYHRDFFISEAKYHEFKNLIDPKLSSKIQLNFRLNYLKDCVLASRIDDSLSNTIISMVYLNNNEIIGSLLEKKESLCEIIEDNTNIKLEDKIIFFSEFFTLLRTLQSQDLKLLFLDFLKRSHFIVFLVDALFSLYSPFQTILSFKTLNMIISISQFIPDVLIQFFLENSRNNKNLLGYLRQVLLENEEEGYQIQCSEFIKFLLEPLHDKKNDLADLLYAQLFTPFLNQLQTSKINSNLARSISFIFESLSFCIKSHGFRIRQFLMHEKFVNALIRLLPVCPYENGLKSKMKRYSFNEKLVQLSCLKLVKSVFGSNDELLIKFFTNKILFQAIISLYSSRQGTNDIVSASVLDLLSILLANNMKKVVKTLSEDPLFLELGSKPCPDQKLFQKILQKNEQFKEKNPFTSMAPSPTPMADPEAYFDEEEEESTPFVAAISEPEEMKKEKLIELRRRMNEDRRKEEEEEGEGWFMFGGGGGGGGGKGGGRGGGGEERGGGGVEEGGRKKEEVKKEEEGGFIFGGEGGGLGKKRIALEISICLGGEGLKEEQFVEKKKRKIEEGEWE